MLLNSNGLFGKFRRVITNGVLLIAIGLLHTQFALSSDGFGKQFKAFADVGFFQISTGLANFPAIVGSAEIQSLCAFWFFYFGILLIPVGLLVHAMERNKQRLPVTFLSLYLVVVLIGCYMIPYSGMSFFMLPHAIYMWFTNRRGVVA